MTKFLLVLLIFLLTGCSSSETTENTNTQTSRLSAIEENISSENFLNVTSEQTPSPTPFTPVQLATYSTKIYTKTEERQNNVRIACEELNGTTVAPGETFSFTETLGPANPEEGYQKAETFDVNGEIIQEYGGGKCQISSTLYNAVLAVPTLTVVERHEHSNDVPYVEEGKDAAVSFGSVDFKFRNDNSYTIRIDASCTEDDITVSIYQIEE